MHSFLLSSRFFLIFVLLQALNELSESLKPFLKEHPEYAKAFEIVQVPERIVQFRVVWEDDSGKPQVNRGYRVQVRFSGYLVSYLSLTYALSVVQLCSRPVQGRSASSPISQPFHPQVLGLRADF